MIRGRCNGRNDKVCVWFVYGRSSGNVSDEGEGSHEKRVFRKREWRKSRGVVLQWSSISRKSGGNRFYREGLGKIEGSNLSNSPMFYRGKMRHNQDYVISYSFFFSFRLPSCFRVEIKVMSTIILYTDYRHPFSRRPTTVRLILRPSGFSIPSSSSRPTSNGTCPSEGRLTFFLSRPRIHGTRNRVLVVFTWLGKAVLLTRVPVHEGGVYRIILMGTRGTFRWTKE